MRTGQINFGPSTFSARLPRATPSARVLADMQPRLGHSRLRGVDVGALDEGSSAPIIVITSLITADTAGVVAREVVQVPAGLSTNSSWGGGGPIPIVVRRIAPPDSVPRR